VGTGKMRGPPARCLLRKSGVVEGGGRGGLAKYGVSHDTWAACACGAGPDYCTAPAAGKSVMYTAALSPGVRKTRQNAKGFLFACCVALACLGASNHTGEQASAAPLRLHAPPPSASAPRSYYTAAPANATSRGDNATASGNASAAASNVGAGVEEPSTRELYRKRWIRTYDEHSSLLQTTSLARPATAAAIRQPATQSPAPPTAQHKTASATEAAAVATQSASLSTAATPIQVTQEAAAVDGDVHAAPCATLASSSQTPICCDASTQTDAVPSDSTGCQTEPKVAAATDEGVQTDLTTTTAAAMMIDCAAGAGASAGAGACVAASGGGGGGGGGSSDTPVEPSAAQQLATLQQHGYPPSMAELERLERLLHAEHEKLMGSLQGQTSSPASSTTSAATAAISGGGGVVVSTAQLGITVPTPSPEYQVREGPCRISDLADALSVWS
jgi:hypothetical protein